MSIVANLKNNDENALKLLFDKYQHAVYHYVLERTKSSYCAKEVAQLTFIKVWQYRHNLKDDVDISYQLFRIVRTTMLDELRKVQKEYMMCDLETSTVKTEELEENIYYNEAKEKLENLIRLMPPMRQRVFYLSRINDYSHKEIAKMLSISTKTVENHIALALKFIKPFFALFLLLSL